MKHTLVWAESPNNKTGYGKQCHFLIRYLKEELGHQVSLLTPAGFIGQTPLNHLTGDARHQGVEVYGGGYERFAQDRLEDLVYELACDNLIALVDAWCFVPWGQTLQRVAQETRFFWWVPIDSQPLQQGCNQLFWQTPDIIKVPMSNFGKAQLEHRGIETAPTVHHCYDPDIYHPRTKGNHFREQHQIPEATTLWLAVGHNNGTYKCRKGFPSAIQGFAEWIRQGNDGVMYMWTRASTSSGHDLPAIARTEGVADRVGFPSDSQLADDKTEEEMAEMFSAADLHVLTSMGEGFGVTSIEAQACGTPVLLSNFSAQPETLADGGGQLVDGIKDWNNEYRAWFFLPDPDDIAHQASVALAAPRPKPAAISRFAYPEPLHEWGRLLA